MPVHDLLLVKLLNILANDPMYSEETQRELKALELEALGANKGGE
jgi:hypothetical protein